MAAVTSYLRDIWDHKHKQFARADDVSVVE